MKRRLIRLSVLTLVAGLFFMVGCDDPFHSSSSGSTGTVTVQGNITDIPSTTVAAGVKAGVTVMLKGTSHSTRTADDGTFVISGVPAGTYTLVIIYGDAEYEYPLGDIADNARVEITDLSVNSNGSVIILRIDIVDLGTGEQTKTVEDSDEEEEETETTAAQTDPAGPIFLDQSFETGGNDVYIITGQNLAQTFTTGTTNAELVKVELWLGNPSAEATDDLTVSIRTVVMGNPNTGTTLGFATVTPADVDVAFSWVTVEFSTPIDLYPSTQYAITLTTTTPFANAYSTESLFHGTYPGGNMWSGTPWTLSSFSHDIYFRTYMQVP